ncbi:MAG TPA: GDSL-type esterase/lipase family protein [Bacteroidia bacterium]|nr:GDSL-type esterase/lipase family protein [Bacteroidia bacterium]
MKKIILLICFSIAFAVIGFYSFVTIKRIIIIHEYFNQEKWNRLSKQYNQMKKVKHSTLFFGDSMTENFKYLPDNDSVVNMGISGDFTEGLIKRITNVTHFQPDKLFIMIGINDIVEKVPMSQIEKNYSQILDTIKTDCPQTKVFIQSTLPTEGLKSLLSSSQSINKKVEKLNAFLKAEAKNRNLVFINMYPDFVDKNNELKKEYSKDGVHLTKKGYDVWLWHLMGYWNSW